MFLPTSEDVLTRHFQFLAAHLRQTARSADLTDDSAVTFLKEVLKDSRVLGWHMTDYLKPQRQQTDRLYCRALPLEAASLLRVESILS